ncbi:MAG: FKBP-type peptidyl-prolyl cis-trans isomerase [Flavobacteriales bacterium]
MRIIIATIVTVLVISCGSGEFSQVAKSVQKKLVVFGEDQTAIKDAKYLDLVYSVSAFNKSKNVSYSNELFLSDFHPSIFGTEVFHEDFAKLHSGDSVIYKLSYFEIKDQILDEFTSNQLILSDSALVNLYIGIQLAMTEEEFLAHSQKKVQQGLIEEMTLINNYISNNNLQDRVIRKGDLHYLKTSETNALAVSMGNDIAIAYTCRFLSEQIFDQVPEDSPLYINLGAPDQVIIGIESILKELKQGETARVIIPSYLAFGENGSTDGRVPPKTPIIADIKLVEIIQ